MLSKTNPKLLTIDYQFSLRSVPYTAPDVLKT